MFTLFSAVLLRPLPYPHAERLVEIWSTVARETIERRGASFPDYFDWRRTSRSFDAMAAWSAGRNVLFIGGADAAFVNTEVVDGPYFEMLGARAIQGRVLMDGYCDPMGTALKRPARLHASLSVRCPRETAPHRQSAKR